MSHIPKPTSRIPKNATRVFNGVIFDVYQWEQVMFDGSTTMFEMAYREPVIMVIPVTVDGQIVIQNEEQPHRGRYRTLPAGRAEKGEDPMAAAKRELLEETGYEGDFELWDIKNTLPKIDWNFYTYIARNCRKVADQSLDNGEKVAVDLISFDQFVEEVTAPDFRGFGLTNYVLRAKLDPQKMHEIKTLLLGRH